MQTNSNVFQTKGKKSDFLRDIEILSVTFKQEKQEKYMYTSYVKSDREYVCPLTCWMWLLESRSFFLGTIVPNCTSSK